MCCSAYRGGLWNGEGGGWKGFWSRGSVTTGCFVTEITLSLPLLLAQSLSLISLCVCVCVCSGCLSFGYIHNTNTHTQARTLSVSSSVPERNFCRLLLHSINQWWPPVKTCPVTVYVEGVDEREWDRLNLPRNKRLTVILILMLNRIKNKVEHVTQYTFPLAFLAKYATLHFTAHILWVWDK